MLTEIKYTEKQHKSYHNMNKDVENLKKVAWTVFNANAIADILKGFLNPDKYQLFVDDESTQEDKIIWVYDKDISKFVQVDEQQFKDFLS